MPLPLNAFDYHYGEIGINLTHIADRHVLFSTDANSDLRDILAHLSEDDQQTFACNLCAQTLQELCNLVYFDDLGQKRAFFWRNYPTDNAEARRALNILAEFVERCPITGIPTRFTQVDRHHPWRVGTAVAGGFGHYWADLRVNQTLRLDHFNAVRKFLSSWLLDDSLESITRALHWINSIEKAVGNNNLFISPLYLTVQHIYQSTLQGMRADQGLISVYANLTDPGNGPTFARGLSALSQLKDSKLQELIINILGRTDEDTQGRIDHYMNYLQHANPVLWELINTSEMLNAIND